MKYFETFETMSSSAVFGSDVSYSNQTRASGNICSYSHLLLDSGLQYWHMIIKIMTTVSIVMLMLQMDRIYPWG